MNRCRTCTLLGVTGTTSGGLPSKICPFRGGRGDVNVMPVSLTGGSLG